MNDILDCVLNKTGGSICSQESYSPFNGTCNPSECQPLVTVNKNEIIFTFFPKFIYQLL